MPSPPPTHPQRCRGTCRFLPPDCLGDITQTGHGTTIPKPQVEATSPRGPLAPGLGSEPITAVHAVRRGPGHLQPLWGGGPSALGDVRRPAPALCCVRRLEAAEFVPVPDWKAGPCAAGSGGRALRKGRGRHRGGRRRAAAPDPRPAGRHCLTAPWDRWPWHWGGRPGDGVQAWAFGNGIALKGAQRWRWRCGSGAPPNTPGPLERLETHVHPRPTVCAPSLVQPHAIHPLRLRKRRGGVRNKVDGNGRTPAVAPHVSL